MKKFAFSLVELMLVLAIIAMLCAIAIPSYKKYVLQAQLIDAVHLVQECRKDIETGFQETDLYPPTAFGLVLHAASAAVVNSATTTNMGYDSTGGSNNPAGANLTWVWCSAQINSAVIPGTNMIHVGAAFSPTQQKLIWYCGTWDATGSWFNSNYVKYLPTECNNTCVSCALGAVT